MKKTIFALLFLSLWGGLHAQNNVGSIYSKYGIGLIPDNYGAYTGMGGVSAAMRDNYNINFLNPASYTALDTSTFYFQAGYTGEYVSLKTHSQSSNYKVAQNAAITMAIRLYKNLYGSIGFNERSDIGYDIYVVKRIIGEENAYFSQLMEGEGGLNEAYLGLGYKIKNLSLGVNIGYIFGKVEERQTIMPISGNFAYYMKTRTQNHINDVLFTFGAQYNIKLNRKSGLLFGATFSPDTYLSGKEIFESYLNNTYVPLDDERLDKGRIRYPMRFTLGSTFSHNRKLLLSGDYTFQQMSRYKLFGNLTEEFNDYHKGALGVSFTPAGRTWWERNWYTAGAYFTRSHINLKQKDINTYGFTFGTQIPFGGGGSAQGLILGVAADLGFRGTKSNGLILEQFAKIRINIAFRESWFTKRIIY